MGGLAGLFSLDTSHIPNAVSHQVRRRLVVYDGGQVDGNSLPRFGSLSVRCIQIETRFSLVFSLKSVGEDQWLSSCDHISMRRPHLIFRAFVALTVRALPTD